MEKGIKILDQNKRKIKAGDIVETINGRKYIFLCCGFISYEKANDFQYLYDFFYKIDLGKMELILCDTKIIGNINRENLIFLISVVFFNFPRTVRYFNRYINPNSKELNNLKKYELFSHKNK